MRCEAVSQTVDTVPFGNAGFLLNIVVNFLSRIFSNRLSDVVPIKQSILRTKMHVV